MPRGKKQADTKGKTDFPEGEPKVEDVAAAEEQEQPEDEEGGNGSPKATEILRVRFEITGISPLLMDAMPAEMVEKVLRKGERGPVDKTKPANDIAREKLYFIGADGKLVVAKDAKALRKGQVVMPTANILAAMVEAGRKVKIGRAALSTAATTTIPGFITMCDDVVPVVSKGGWEVDERRGVNPNGGTAVSIVRPKFMDWALTFEVELQLGEGFTFETACQLVQYAGRFIGLGSYRPTRKGPYGRSKLVKVTILESTELPQDFEVIDLTGILAEQAAAEEATEVAAAG